MDMQQIKKLLLAGEKVDIECKEAQKRMPVSAYESYWKQNQRNRLPKLPNQLPNQPAKLPN